MSTDLNADSGTLTIVQNRRSDGLVFFRDSALPWDGGNTPRAMIDILDDSDFVDDLDDFEEQAGFDHPSKKVHVFRAEDLDKIRLLRHLNERPVW